MNDFEIYLDGDGGRSFVDSVRGRRFSLALVISHTDTSEIPGLTAAGSSPEMMRFTPPADAEFIHYGSCMCIDTIPTTPDGKPTPALLTKVALESASIPHMVINAGSRVLPNLPFIATNLPHGNNIRLAPAMDPSDVVHAVDFGRIVGRALAAMTDCLIIGESLPAGTTTAMAVLQGLGYDVKTSSSSRDNPVNLKKSIIEQASSRLKDKDPFSVVANMGDPMIPFVSGMLSTASGICKVLLAGGTQMAAVLAFAKTLGFHSSAVAIGTTRYIVDDKSADLLDTVRMIGGVPVIAVDPGLSESKIPGLKAFSQGFAKEGVGAGGSLLSAMLRAELGRDKLLEKIEGEYNRTLLDRD